MMEGRASKVSPDAAEVTHARNALHPRNRACKKGAGHEKEAKIKAAKRSD